MTDVVEKNVLLVDDSDTDALVLKREFERGGLKTRSFG
jgi:ActR/RegA family two-component response regulator